MIDLVQPPMNFPDDSTFRLDSFFARRLRGNLRQGLAQAARFVWICQQARNSGLSVSDAELQAAADLFRRQERLHSATATHKWLKEHGLSIADLEADLEKQLLIRKLRDQVTNGQIEPHFAARQDEYARVRLRQIVVDTEELARELLCQVRDEGRDFGELARLHSVHVPSMIQFGRVGVLYRKQVPTICEVLFDAPAGQVVEPITTPNGFHLFLVDEALPAELDKSTMEDIREELFQVWLQDRLKEATIDIDLNELLR